MYKSFGMYIFMYVCITKYTTNKQDNNKYWHISSSWQENAFGKRWAVFQKKQVSAARRFSHKQGLGVPIHIEMKCICINYIHQYAVLLLLILIILVVVHNWLPIDSQYNANDRCVSNFGDPWWAHVHLHIAYCPLLIAYAHWLIAYWLPVDTIPLCGALCNQ